MHSPPPFQPRDADELADFLRGRSEAGGAVTLQGGGSKQAFGRPPGDDQTLIDLSGLSGILLYQPDELVLTARAGARLEDISAATAERGQCLAPEPPDFGLLFGGAENRSTLGGAVASGWSGPRRIKVGAIRDHVLGARAIGGDGQAFQSGGRVVKNVTGFDLPKLLTGSHGTLAAMTEITIKVLPVAEISRTLVILGLGDAAALRVLSDALGGPFDVSGAAHLPLAAAARSSVKEIAQAGAAATLVRLEGFAPSVADRFEALRSRFERMGEHLALGPEGGAALWREARDVAALIDSDKIVWRLSLPPSDAAAAIARIARATPVDAFYDWGGALVWLTLPPAPDAHAGLVRSALPAGHAILMRASADCRARTPIFHPQAPALAALGRRVKAAFDPAAILAPGSLFPEA